MFSQDAESPIWIPNHLTRPYAADPIDPAEKARPNRKQRQRRVRQSLLPNMAQQPEKVLPFASAHLHVQGSTSPVPLPTLDQLCELIQQAKKNLEKLGIPVTHLNILLAVFSLLMLQVFAADDLSLQLIIGLICLILIFIMLLGRITE